MAEVSIDRSKLPGVKEVCRDFAVREDHTLAHSLQEQEIEHHLATNIQRNRLVKHDLQMAKQLQEEEDRKARIRLQEQHKNLEQQDCEIAQEIQVKLVIEAEQQRRQEEGDEDIARILQQKELQEEKRRKKLPPDPLRLGASEEVYPPENRDPLSGNPREPGPKLPRPGSTERQPPQRREPRGGPPLLSEGLDLETWESSPETRKAKDGRSKDREKRERKKDGHGRPPHHEDPADVGVEEEEEEDRARSRPNWSQDKTRGPRLLLWDAEPPRAGRGGRDPRRPPSHERAPRTPPPPTEREEEWRSGHRSCGPRGQGERGPTPNGRERQAERRYGQSRSPNPDRRGLPPQEDRSSPWPPAHHHARHQDPEAAPRHQPRREDGEREPRGARASPTSHRREGRDGEGRRPRNAGAKPRGSKEDPFARPRSEASRDPEAYDAEIAWKLQEEELRASQVDRRAAQVAQDEQEPPECCAAGQEKDMTLTEAGPRSPHEPVHRRPKTWSLTLALRISITWHIRYPDRSQLIKVTTTSSRRKPSSTFLSIDTDFPV
ncbi:coiled-coil domain-containing protein 50 isoform X3 [Crotalus tigris]|uniref:coiled-coil domain-containing protein 50 isoform X3 n=1 Tax=Crotalus tigris TaxID=88082 RepID=UPI00192F5C48|nr:coiled-coil domain-containing protein 50 isoform X3 [Crotalus tigris]